MMGQIWRRLQLLAAQGVATLVSQDKVQVGVLDGEVLNNVARVQPYGFSHRPKPGAQVYMVFPGGDRSYGVALVVGDKRYTMELAEGEVALHDDHGNYVLIQPGGVIKAKASTKVLADVPLFETTGDCKVAGTLEVVGDTRLKSALVADGATQLKAGLAVTGAAAVTGAVSAAGYGGAGGVGKAQMPAGAVIEGVDVKLHRHNETGTGGGTTTAPI
jgi:phage baseplate assembly protein V